MWERIIPFLSIFTLATLSFPTFAKIEDQSMEVLSPVRNREKPQIQALMTRQSILCQLAQLEKKKTTGIDLSQRKVTESEMRELLQRLQLIPPTHPPSLSLFFTSSNLDSAAARILAYDLPLLTSFVGLVLAKATIDPEGITAILKALPDCKYLQYLNLAFLPLENRDICRLTACNNLKILDLKGCGVSDAGVEKLAHSLPTLPHLYALDLSDNPIGDAGAQALIDAIASLPSSKLQMLYLVKTQAISLPLKRDLVAACNAKKITLFFGGDDVREVSTQTYLLDAAIYWKGRRTPANVQVEPVLFIL